MRNAMKWFGLIALVAIIVFGVVACSDGNGNGGGSGTFANLAGTWVKDTDDTYTLTFSNVEKGNRGYSFNVSGKINHSYVEAVNGSSTVFGGAGDDSFKLTFDGEKLKISDAKGSWTSANGLYIKQP